jgi:Zn-dependent M28 family amino/carboxypeptidase
MFRVLAAGFLALAVALVAAAGLSGGDDPPPAAPPAAPAPAAGAGDPAVHVRALARAARDGTRAAGTAGARASEDYVAERLRAAGYRVVLERVPFPYFDERRPPRVRAGGRAVRAVTMAYSPGGRVRGPVRTVGLGCAPGDFAGVREGEVALARRGVCPFRVKARLGERAGAAAVLVSDEGEEPVSATLGAPGLRIPALAIGEDGARRVTAAGRVDVRVVAVSERRTTRNVVGEHGGDGRLVMLGAHLDSVPAGPGMNDNASGAAAALAAAERFARDGTGPVRVAFWGAEELGLYGSRHHVAGLGQAARRRIAAYINLDMVGTPGGEAAVYDTDDGVERALRRALRASGRAPSEEDLGASSDHAAFQRAGVPVGGVFTGLDDCYHRACDRLGNVDLALVRDVTAAVTRAAKRLSRTT